MRRTSRKVRAVIVEITLPNIITTIVSIFCGLRRDYVTHTRFASELHLIRKSCKRINIEFHVMVRGIAAMNQESHKEAKESYNTGNI
jgi:hypothetical protein